MKKNYDSAQVLMEEIISLSREEDLTNPWNIIHGHWYNYALDIQLPSEAKLDGADITVLGVNEEQDYHDLGYESEKEVANPFIAVDILENGKYYTISLEEIEESGASNLFRLFLEAWKNFLAIYYK